MRFLFFILLFASLRTSFSQCDSMHFVELGTSPAYCRLAYYQTGNGVVYASAIGTGPCTYEWTNLATGQMNYNTTWGGLNIGLYKIIATDSIGCTISETVKLDSINPHANFGIENIVLDDSDPLNNFATVTLKNLCDEWANGPIAFPEFSEPYYHWNLNLDTTWTALEGWQKYEFEISDPGFYTVCIATQNMNGCVDTACHSISISPPVFEEDSVNVYYSSVTGEVSIELLLFEEVIFNLIEINGVTSFQYLLQPGINTFQLGSGIYAYEIINSQSTEIICSGTIAIF